MGMAASLVCYGTILLKNRLGYDDSLDVFGIHGVAGILGALLLTSFIRPSWMKSAAAAAGGTWTVFDQLGVQAAGVGITIVYSAVVTFLILFLVGKTVGFRLNEKGEMSGLDITLHGEHGYGLINLS
jgi:Amt family ammonium transporter